MSTDAEYMADEIYKKLSGGRITNAIRSENDDGEESFGFLVERNGKTIQVWVDCDAEVNGPGWLKICEETS